MKLAIIGTGKIVHEALFAIEELSEIEKVAIYARAHSKEKADELAKKYGIKEVYTDYNELLEKSDCDTVYIGLVNSAHFQYSKEALLAGKNVILEKPFTETLEQALELKKIAEDKGLFLLEAITVLHNPVFDRAKAVLDELGPKKMFMANYSQYSSRYDDYKKGVVAPAFDPELGGGALGDINVYNIHYAVALFGMPNSVEYFPNKGFNGVDTSGMLILSYDGFSAMCTGAKDSDSPSFVTIQGEDGYMTVNGKPNSSDSLTLVTMKSTDDKTLDAAGSIKRQVHEEVFTKPEMRHRMTQEFIDFAEIIDGKNYDMAKELLEESITVVKVLKKARQ